MSRARNHVIYNTDREELTRLRDEYESLGRRTKLEDGKLIVFALPPRR